MNEELIDLTTEETINIDINEVVENEIKAEDLTQDIETDETFEMIEVETVEEINVDFEEAVGWVGGDNTRHYSLYGRDEPDQHPITAITGLRDELDSIEALQTVYSDEKGRADYYEWEDGNVLTEDRVGYFVAVCEDIRTIKICTVDDEIFGVTVDNAAFIGGQDDVLRDCKYGLVAHCGIANVRCELDVKVGDFVVSNNYGMAEKAVNNYGCKVIAIQDIDGVRHATISLDISINQMDAMGQEFNNFDARMGIAEKNIISAINVANEAYNLASNMDFDGLSKDVIDKANTALGKADEALTNSENAEIGIQEAIKISQEAIAIANTLTTTAESIRKEAVDKANETEASVNDLIKDLEPLTSWDADGNYSGSSYLAEYIKDEVATKAEIETAENLIQKNTSSIEKSSKKLQTFVSTIDKYCVGEVSPAYGLTTSQSSSILESGMIYVPIEIEGVDGIDGKSHIETYEDENSPITQEFLTTYYYTWNGTHWEGSESGMVAFSKIAPVAGEGFQYWYTGEEVETPGYDTQTLYLWDNWGTEDNPDYYWMAVDTLKDAARVNSMITQTTNSIASEITNGTGGVNSIRQYLSDYESTTTSLNEWRGNITDENGELKVVKTIAAVEEKADENGASITQMVQSIGSNGQITAATIKTAINNDKSSIKLAAHNIDLTGFTTINKTFTIDTDGYMRTTGGTVGGWTIVPGQLYTTVDVDKDKGTTRTTGIQAQGYGYWSFAAGATDYSSWATAPFRVSHSGVLYADEAHITGDITAKSFKSVSTKTYAEFDDDQLKFFKTNDTKPKISIGYPAAGDPYIALGIGTSTDNFTGRFFINKDSDSAQLTYCNGSSLDHIATRIQMTDEKINLRIGTTELQLNAASLRQLATLLGTTTTEL